jgi:hypothetical protein
VAERYDALTVRESNGKSYFTKLGAMFPNKSGDGFTLVLDAVPASVDGQYRILLKVPQARDDRQQQAPAQDRQAQSRNSRFESDPAPSWD